jgi:hypothetical protein
MQVFSPYDLLTSHYVKVCKTSITVPNFNQIAQIILGDGIQICTYEREHTSPRADYSQRIKIHRKFSPEPPGQYFNQTWYKSSLAKWNSMLFKGN